MEPTYLTAWFLGNVSDSFCCFMCRDDYYGGSPSVFLFVVCLGPNDHPRNNWGMEADVEFKLGAATAKGEPRIHTHSREMFSHKQNRKGGRFICYVTVFICEGFSTQSGENTFEVTIGNPSRGLAQVEESEGGEFSFVFRNVSLIKV